MRVTQSIRSNLLSWILLSGKLETQARISQCIGTCAGHLENYQDVDASDPKGETAVYKAARNDDTAKLELLDLACADLDLQASWLHPRYLCKHGR